MSTPIPGPAGWPFLGNLTDVDPEIPIKSISDLADQYGEHKQSLKIHVYKCTY
jgi:cytochrome P450/NADPH-cytochrome P450 reductase